MKTVKNKKEIFMYYYHLLGDKKFALEYAKYLKAPSLLRLQKISYFCYVDYASKNVFNFKEHITRFDHSLTTALITKKFTSSKKEILSGLFHDIATPCFSHAIDYMNEDYTHQESTEEYTEYILKKDKYLLKCLKEDNIDVEDLVYFKQFSLVDTERPKLCADRLDGIILPGISWTQNVTPKDIQNIISSLEVFKNEEGQKELGFTSLQVAQKVMEVSDTIDDFTHSPYDNFLMTLLARITKLAISKKYITYESLYFYTEEELIQILKNTKDTDILSMLNEFLNVKKEEIPNKENPLIKKRVLNPIVNGERLYRT